MPPVIIAGAIAGAATIGGAAIAAGSQKSAAKSAANIASQNNQDNIAFQREMYDKNSAHFAPYEASGATANSAIMQLLGYGGGADNPGAFSSTGGVNPSSAFQTYLNSDGYQFRLGEGVNALQKAFGRNLDSGAAMKAAVKYGQGTASDEFSRYMSLLNQQQQLGYGSASALAGVGQNFANNVVAGNNTAADAAANARLYAGSANANMWQNIGSSFGQFAGQAFGPGGFGSSPYQINAGTVGALRPYASNMIAQYPGAF